MFEKQTELFKIAMIMLHTQYTGEWSFGGGTALSACYWNYRSSTDIDIFLNDTNFDLQFFRPTPHNKKLQEKIFHELKRLGYVDFYFNSSYFEMAFDDDSKIQFIRTSPLTSKPTNKLDVFDFKDISVETPEEIIAKKLFHRGMEFKPRDLIDIAMAISKNKDFIFNLIQDKAFTLDMLDEYEQSLDKVSRSEKNKNAIIDEVKAIQVRPEYYEVAKNAFEIIFECIQYTFKKHIKFDIEEHNAL
jgi:predicted nucleotidyltransferase component of viral defense system